MADIVEIGELVVRLTGEAAEFRSMLDEASSSIAEVAANVETMAAAIEASGTSAVAGAAAGAEEAAAGFTQTEEALGGVKAEVENSGKEMEQFGVTMNNLGTVVAVGAMKAFENLQGTILKLSAAYSIFRGQIAAISAFTEWERKQMRLTAILTANERDVKFLTKSYKEFAEETARTTTASVGQIMALIQTAELQGKTGDTAKRAARNAIGLAAATDQSAEAMIYATLAMEEGNAALLMRIRALRGIHGDEAKIAKARELIARGLAVEADATKSTSHQIDLMQRAAKKLGIELGGATAIGTLPMVKAMTALINTLNKLDPALKGPLFTVVSLAVGFSALVPLYGILKKATLGLWAAMLANPFVALAAIVAAATVAMYAYAKSVSGTDAALEKAAESQKKFNELQSKRAAGALSDVLAAPDPGTRKLALEGLLEGATRELAKYDEAIKRNENIRKKLPQNFADVMQEGAGLGDSMRMLGDLMTRTFIGDPTADTLKTLETSRGRIREEIARIQTELDKLAAPQLSDELKEQLKELDKSLSLQIATFSMTQNQAKLYELAMKGAADADLQFIKEKMDMVAGLEAGAKAFEEQEKAAEEYGKRMEDLGESIRKEIATPQEQLAARMAELNEVLEAGQITWEEYDRAVQLANKSTAQTTAVLDRLAGRFDAVAVGSAEAASRLEEYQEKLGFTRFRPRGVSAGTEVPRAAPERPLFGVSGLPAEKAVTDLLRKILEALLEDKGSGREMTAVELELFNFGE